MSNENMNSNSPIDFGIQQSANETEPITKSLFDIVKEEGSTHLGPTTKFTVKDQICDNDQQYIENLNRLTTKELKKHTNTLIRSAHSAIDKLDKGYREPHTFTLLTTELLGISLTGQNEEAKKLLSRLKDHMIEYIKRDITEKNINDIIRLMKNHFKFFFSVPIRLELLFEKIDPENLDKIKSELQIFKDLLEKKAQEIGFTGKD